MNKPVFETSHAILVLNGKYVLQLRDNIPTISAPGTWSFFGGRIDLAEEPLEAMRRELFEELSIVADDVRFLWRDGYYDDFTQSNVVTWFFVSDVSGVWGGHELKEGAAVGVFGFDETKALNMPIPFRDALIKFHTENIK